MIDIDPKYTEAIHHLASVHWKMGDRDQAVRYDRLYLERGNHAGLRKISRERLAGAQSGK